ncbi:hypothetical protein COO60DRAFT_1657583 [Scenedesmus sp. NREL 46B-D3]|nr:hypothetical protein COO60DRAFT_1657583 [Scenedesmus sp. NREL 46B-D3]
MEDDVLSLSLAGGFESRHPINFTIVMPAASQLRYVANYGSGAVVLGPGHSTPSLRLSAPTVGPIQAFNLTADSLYLSSNGVLGSSVSGAFNQAEIVTDVATGSSIITGTAGGLSKVQYTAGSCYVSSEISVPFPAPSIFGPGGFGFAAGNAQQQGESKCQLVQPGQVEPVVATASNPQWTCGVIVDGRLSCQQGANATDQALQWDIQNTTTPQPAPTAHVVAPPPNIGTLDNATATSPNPATNAAATATPAAIATTAGNGASGIGAETASPSPGSPANADTAAANSTSAGSSTSNIREQAAVDNAANAAGAGNGGGATTVTALAPPAPVDSPVTNVAGSYTSGPGASSFSSGSVGDTMQTTSSQGGSAPTTTLSTGGVGSDLFNPVVVPATPPEAFAADNASSATPPSPSTTQTAGAAAVNGTAAPPSPPARAAAGAAGAGAPTSLPDSERIHTAGPSGASGVAVVNTVCSSRQQSLSMLVQPAAEPQRASRSFPLRPGGTGGAAAAPGAGGAGVAGGGGGSGLEGSAGNAAPASP